MAYWMHFWRLTPDQFDNLEMDAYDGMARYMDRWNKEQQKG
jgi:hypothetical protein